MSTHFYLGSRVPFVASAALVASLAIGSAAYSQTTLSAPPGSLFGSGDTRPVHHGLDVALTAVGGYDSDTPPELERAGSAGMLFSGASTMFVTDAEYRWRSRRVEVGATAGSVFRNYTSLEEDGTVSTSLGIGVAAQVGGRTTIFANQTAAYSPSYLYLLFPGDDVKAPGDTHPAAPNYAITHSQSHLYGTALSLTQGVTRRSHLSTTANVQLSRFSEESVRDQRSQGIRTDYLVNLSKRVALRVGYQYRTGQFGYFFESTPSTATGSATDHGAEVGIDYSRPIAANRQMALRFSLGSSNVKLPPFASVVEGQRFIRLTGGAEIEYPFATSWRVRGNLRRGLEYVAPLGAPVYASGFSAEMIGLISTRVDISASTRYSSGVSALSRSALAYDTYGTECRVRYALTRTWAVYGEYLYYFYDFRRSTQLPPGVPPGLQRNGIRAGLTLWIPAFRR